MTATTTQSHLETLRLEILARQIIRPEIERHADPIDQALADEHTSRTAAERDRDAAILRQIDAAREALHAGTYGRCDACGRAISPKRLEAVPWATLCVRCQETEDERAA